VNADGSGTASAAISSPSVGSVSTNAIPCTLSVVRTNTGLQVKPGAIWATFNCPEVVDPPSTNCQAYGEFVFENCAN
jgi:hypothetical protein